jgi:hypothetical protein
MPNKELLLSAEAIGTSGSDSGLSAGGCGSRIPIR